jgi:Zn finger protein HypA/HybF involved in hydrogenase expression
VHEFSLVAELVDEVGIRAAGRQVAAVRVRHASTIEEETLRQAFSMLTADGPLAGAQLEAEAFEIALTCPACGFVGGLDHDHLHGHIRVCPSCGAVSGDSQVCELEMLDLRFHA